MKEQEALIKNNEKFWLSEVFNFARRVQPITHPQLNCPFIVRIEASDMRLASAQRLKKYDHEKRFGCTGVMENRSCMRSNQHRSQSKGNGI